MPQASEQTYKTGASKIQKHILNVAEMLIICK